MFMFIIINVKEVDRGVRINDEVNHRDGVSNYVNLIIFNY